MDLLSPYPFILIYIAIKSDIGIEFEFLVVDGRTPFSDLFLIFLLL